MTGFFECRLSRVTTWPRSWVRGSQASHQVVENLRGQAGRGYCSIPETIREKVIKKDKLLQPVTNLTKYNCKSGRSPLCWRKPWSIRPFHWSDRSGPFLHGHYWLKRSVAFYRPAYFHGAVWWAVTGLGAAGGSHTVGCRFPAPRYRSSPRDGRSPAPAWRHASSLTDVTVRLTGHQRAAGSAGRSGRDGAEWPQNGSAAMSPQLLDIAQVLPLLLFNADERTI